MNKKSRTASSLLPRSEKCARRSPKLAERAAALKVGHGADDATDVGPVISPRARARAEELIAAGVEDGAEVLLDGRGVEVDGYPDGNFVGPTVRVGCSITASSTDLQTCTDSSSLDVIAIAIDGGPQTTVVGALRR